jgi:pyruvate/2-oxoglutarate dehydrogenase complex dihydrolipoamide acyltransferase (E2) component
MVKAGDTLAADDSIMTVESDKAAMDIPAPFAGTVTELKIQVGDKVAAGSLVLLMDTSDAVAPTAAAPVVKSFTPPPSPPGGGTEGESALRVANLPLPSHPAPEVPAHIAPKHRPAPVAERAEFAAGKLSTPARRSAASPANSAPTSSRIRAAARARAAFSRKTSRPSSRPNSPSRPAKPSACRPDPGAGDRLRPVRRNRDPGPVAHQEALRANLHRNWVRSRTSPSSTRPTSPTWKTSANRCSTKLPNGRQAHPARLPDEGRGQCAAGTYPQFNASLAADGETWC